MDARLYALQDRVKKVGGQVAQSLSKKFLYDPDTKRPFPSSPLYPGNFDPNDPSSIMMVGGMVGPVSSVGSEGTKIVTGLVSKSDMTPHVLEEGGKVYSSIRQAIKAAKMKPQAEGEVFMPRAVHPPHLDVLKQRFADLQKHGASTVNVEKAIAKEMELYKK